MRRSRFNTPLFVGGLICALLTVIAIFGPSLAPHDPMKGDATIFVDGRVYGPQPLRPLGPFRSWIYPLGIDTVGRDHYSRLLWSVRPTMLLCVVIVAVRLVLGVLLGVLSGWFGGRVHRAIDTLTGVATAIPLLAVAIAVILVVGLERGLIAFVIGLAVTGWAETATIVRSRVLSVRQAPYIEAARAIGRTPTGLLVHHVVPQLWTILPMLIAFEFSAVLLIVAELGYLGFFIGGGFLYSDEFAGNFLTTGLPELGQMLSQFFGLLNQTPWVAISAGLVVFSALIGFTLLGEGLRRRMDITRPQRSWWARLRRVAEPGEQPNGGDGFARPPRSRPLAERVWWLPGAGVALLIVLTMLSLRGIEARAATARAAFERAEREARIGVTPIPTAQVVQSAVPDAGPVDVSTTPKPLDQIDAGQIAALLLQNGDLPIGYAIDDIDDRVPSTFNNAPKPATALTTQLNFNGLNAGRLTVLLYTSAADRDSAYNVPIAATRDNAGPVDLPISQLPWAFGEQRTVLDTAGAPGQFPMVLRPFVVWTRCNMVVHVQITRGDAIGAPIMAGYMERLDRRLAPLVCQP